MTFILCTSIQELPKLSIGDPLGEIELCAGYLDPLLSLLFNDFENSTDFRWANKITNESQQSKVKVNSQRRPDVVTAVMNQRKFNESRGFGEAKTDEALNGNYCLTKNLIRLGIFGKQAIDVHSMNTTPHSQAIGNLRLYNPIIV
ncbi:hypothetical protein K501DRAFT_201686 [Backusella circina FSU 941]|nr:hypothetical protein K501DRAFT_201686 [Backusella circina FSU 941]